jgi:peroxiredoxin (alkyl hydroperoxide reductase subunit C)
MSGVCDKIESNSGQIASAFPYMAGRRDKYPEGGLMTDKKPEGCVQTAAGPIRSKPSGQAAAEVKSSEAKEVDMRAMVGKEAPDFEAAAFLDGGFKNIRLSDLRGQWVMLCFYPGDFTFV